MLKLLNGKDSFYQWDSNQKIVVADETVSEVHFTNSARAEALICEVYEENGIKVANVPNILLQEVFDILAYAYCGECYTKQHARYKVIARSKPSDYIYTETEVKSYEKLENDIKAIEANVANITDENIIQDRKIQALEDNQGNFIAQTHYNPESPLAQSGRAVAEALATVGSNDFELISDLTITENIAEVVWNTTDSGEPLTNYKDFFIYFLGNFTATENKALYCRSNDGSCYHMWCSVSKNTNARAFWILIESLFKTDEIDCDTSTNSYNGTQIYKSTFPQNLLGNVNKEKLITQGLADNNRTVCSDVCITGSNSSIEKLHIGQGSEGSIFASGSRFLLLGRKA